MKKRKTAILALTALSVILATALAAARQAGDRQEVLLEKAIQMETVDGDLEAAIGLYKKIVAATGSSRAIVAKALLRLGGCYEKLGLDEARKAYERLVREFADQSEQAMAARGRLVALGRPAEAGKEGGFAVKKVWADADGVFTHSPSPDGKFMAFADYSESGNLGIRDLETGKSRLLTNEGTWQQPQQMAYSSKWSPDGKQIAYCWQHGSWAELRVLNVDDTKPRVLYGDEAGDAWVSPEDWSPDGRHILVSIGRSDGPELALVPVQGGSPRVLKKFEPRTISSGSGGEKQFSPDGRHIVYDRTPGLVAATDIFVLDLATGRETPLVRHSADDRVFGWSPDGGWVLFASDRSGILGLWAIRVADGQPQGQPVAVNPSVGRIAPLGFTRDGSFYYADVKAARDVHEARIDFETGKVLAPPRKAIERYEGSNMNPRYSPDGKALAYVSRRGSMVYPTNRANALCIHSLETGGERVFMDEFVNLGIRALAGPRWSPDGRSIAVAGWRETGGSRNGIYLAELETGRVTVLYETPPDVRVRNHEFSGDGRLFFYIRTDRNEAVSRILARDLRSGQEHEIYRESGDNVLGGMAASPDGKWLATISNRRELALIPTGGGPARVVRRFDEDIFSAPEWLPDGRSVIVGGQSPNELEKTTLFVVPVDGGKPREVVLQTWFWDRPTVHPDGQRVAWACVVNPDTAADVWVLRNFLPK